MTGRDFSITKFMDAKRIDPDGFTSYEVPAIIEKRERESEFAVKEYIKCGGAYIPGSSIKGAIRTALMWYFLNEDGNKDIVFNSLEHWLNKNKITNRDLKKIDDQISQKVFGEDAHHDILRALRISDTNAVGMEHLEVSEIKIVGNPQDIPVYIENLKIGTEMNFDLYIDDKLLNVKENELNFREHPLKQYINVNRICEACNALSGEVVDKHLKHNWKKYNHGDVREEFKNLEDEIEACDDNETILHIGWGGGWYSTTIGLLVEKHPKFTTSVKGSPKHWKLNRYTLRNKFRLGKKPRSNDYSINFPKTRRITIEGEPLGWVKITME